MNHTPIWIELKRNMTFLDYPGRYTELTAGTKGFVLDEEIIKKMNVECEEKRKKLLINFKLNNNSKEILAVIAGYPTFLEKSDFSYVEGDPGLFPEIF